MRFVCYLFAGSFCTSLSSATLLYSDLILPVFLELQDIVQFLKDPAAFATLGGKLPKGVLLTGFVFSALRFTRSHPLLVHLGRVKLCLREQLRAKPVSHFSLLLGELKNILSA